jgi:4-amino-4-deoxy-L-arabinose transferase-like glycosyltransferase
LLRGGGRRLAEAMGKSVLFAAAMLGVACAAYLYGLGGSPIHLWDEARLAVSSIEMMSSPNPLIVTFHGEPDVWSSKPPLAIWLYALSMRLFGVNETALRLPAALAAVVTTLIVYLLTLRIARAPWIALLASLILMGTIGYVGTHGARSADYEPILILFTTIYAASFFLALEAEDLRRRRLWLLACAIGLAAAMLTKGVAGVLLAPALVLYALIRGQLWGLARDPSAWLAAGLAVAAPALYYGAREALAPGYLALIWDNELGGRFSRALESHAGPWSYYLSELVSPDWLRWARRPTSEPYFGGAFPWSLAAPVCAVFALASREPVVRRAGLYLGLCILIFLAIVSSSSTKIPWYLGPLHPLTATLVGLGAFEAWSRLKAAPSPIGVFARAAFPAAALGLGALLVGLVAFTNARLADYAPQLPSQAATSLIRAVHNRRPDLKVIQLIHPGHGTVKAIRNAWIVGEEPYYGPEEFYVASLGREGVRLQVSATPQRAISNAAVIRCEEGQEASLPDDKDDRWRCTVRTGQVAPAAPRRTP